jgi:hypothetical protein
LWAVQVSVLVPPGSNRRYKHGVQDDVSGGGGVHGRPSRKGPASRRDVTAGRGRWSGFGLVVHGDPVAPVQVGLVQVHVRVLHVVVDVLTVQGCSPAGLAVVVALARAAGMSDTATPSPGRNTKPPIIEPREHTHHRNA